MSDCNEDIREFIAQNFLYGDETRLGDDSSFLDNGIVDSTGILELVAFLEEKYGIVINDDELVPANLDSLDNIRVFLSKKLIKETPAVESGKSGITDPAAIQIV